MQANGAEMLRIACILMVRQGIGLCAPVHDAVLIEAPLDRLEGDVAIAQECMREASRLVLANFELNSDVKVIRHPDRFQDERGTDMWKRVMGLMDTIPENDTPPSKQLELLPVEGMVLQAGREQERFHADAT